MTPEKPADDFLKHLTAILLPFAESRPRRPVTAGPPELPDLVRAMVVLADGTPAFATRAMVGDVSADQWRLVGGFYLRIGHLCRDISSRLDTRE